MDHKRLDFKVTDGERGEVRAVFSTFNVVDKDGDVTLPGAFEDGAVVPISAYGHTSWQGELPVGLATIGSNTRQAVADGRFFMSTTHGADTFRTVKELAERGLGEWSYGYDPIDFSFSERDGQQVRILERVKVYEVSPVLIGAGVNTRTLSAKGGHTTTPGTGGATLASVGAGSTSATWTTSAHGTPPAPAPSWKHAIRPHAAELTDERWEPAAMVAGIKSDATVSELRSVFAWSQGDPEAVASYRFAHHHGPGGPANVRALVMGIAELNSPKAGEALEDDDRLAVYEHLASHLRDAELEPPELRPAGAAPKQIDRVAALLAECSTVLAEVREVGSSRAGRGKSLSTLTLKALGWHRADLAELDATIAAMLATEQEEIDREYARFLRGLLTTL